MNGIHILRWLLAAILLITVPAKADLALQELQVFTPELRPASGLVQAMDGYFYGVTANGGAFDAGMIYRLAPGSAIEVVHSFSRMDPQTYRNVGGCSPEGTLVSGPEGCLYGFTNHGGTYGYGVVFRYDLGGTFLTLYDLDPITGFDPQYLIRSTTGDLYVLTRIGGSQDGGTLF